MNIAGVEYDLNHRALCIYISGCDGACSGCHNQELWDFDVGDAWTIYSKNINQKLSTSIVKNVWIMGGEPLLQEKYSLELLLKYLYQYKKPICLWTRFYDVPENIKQYLSYIKVGEYQKDSDSYIEPLFGIKLASGNQRITKL